ncbi:hypothetical protein ACIBL3_46560 [Kribbella sp. NPDC050124]|uniref:hypothetical protein n=1 Tax=Kribbella sp. NPDC050124 TaxID=3364114 RepID=UPI0037B5B3F6
MLIIKLTKEAYSKPLDAMSDEEIFEVGRGNWVLGERADQERYVVIGTGAQDGISGKVRVAAEIEEIVDTDERRRNSTKFRRRIEGTMLGPGHPVYDEWVGKEMPPYQNPVNYQPTHHDQRNCRCGCGEVVMQGAFMPGHDQRAIHERIAKIGSVADFIRWFDKTYRG